MDRACSDTVVELANCKSDLVILMAEKSTWITREKELKDNIKQCEADLEDLKKVQELYDALKVSEIADGSKYYRAKIEALEVALRHEKHAREVESIYIRDHKLSLTGETFICPSSSDNPLKENLGLLLPLNQPADIEVTETGYDNGIDVSLMEEIKQKWMTAIGTENSTISIKAVVMDYLQNNP